jgi:hypothetical protein
MLYACIECRSIWCSLDKFRSLNLSDIDLETCLDISHGICPICFQKHENKIHQHQKKQGGVECFNKRDGCDNNECLFKSACGDSAIVLWKSRVVVLRDNNPIFRQH